MAPTWLNRDARKVESGNKVQADESGSIVRVQISGLTCLTIVQFGAAPSASNPSAGRLKLRPGWSQVILQNVTLSSGRRYDDTARACPSMSCWCCSCCSGSSLRYSGMRSGERSHEDLWLHTYGRLLVSDNCRSGSQSNAGSGPASRSALRSGTTLLLCI